MHLLHLAEDDAPLALDGLLREARVLQDVAEHVQRGGHVAALHVGKEGGLLAGGVGVEARAHVLDLHLERVGVGAALGALESHVLEEVRRAVGAGQLEAAAGVDPDADGGHAGGGRVGLGDDAEAGGERGDARGGEAEERGVVGGAGQRRRVAEEAVGRGGGGGVEETVEVRQEPAPRAHGGGGGGHVLDGVPLPLPSRRRKANDIWLAEV